MFLKEVFDLWDTWSALPESKRTEALAHLRALSEADVPQTRAIDRPDGRKPVMMDRVAPSIGDERRKTVAEITEELRLAYDETDTQMGMIEGLLTALDDVITECQTIAPTYRAHAIQVLLDCLRERVAKMGECHEAERRAMNVRPMLAAAE